MVIITITIINAFDIDDGKRYAYCGSCFKYPLSKISPIDKALFSNLIFVIFQSPPTTEEKWPNARNTPLVKSPKRPRWGGLKSNSTVNI